ncbi:MAG: hypothetical protein AMS24_04385 [Chlamydiae bacterium SM23_39]|nr:MAG: hypothetical protein AMS24_04385 [Chlamydiae bacterium SM23_39]
MNFIHLAGHLGADPEVRFTSTGQKVTTLRVAARVRRSNADDTIWWRVTIWGEQFDKMISYFKKGSAIIVMGEMSKPEIFTDREGHPQISLSVTASNIMFSPFGRSDRSSTGFDKFPNVKKEEENVDENTEEISENEEEYATFASGEGDMKDNINDDDIPF